MDPGQIVSDQSWWWVIASPVIGVVTLLLGLSFARKSIQALIFGRFKYWQGFLPITIISPFLIHLPEGKDSLIKTNMGLWVHIILGPVFFLCSVICLAYGADRFGLPGCQALNFVLTLGRHDVPAAVVKGAHGFYSFPILGETVKAFYKLLTWGIPNQNGSGN